MKISKREIDSIISKSTAKATAVAALPIPILDLVGVAFIQVNMIDKIAQKHNLSIDHKEKSILVAVIGVALAKLTSMIAISMTKKMHLRKVVSKELIEASIIGLTTTIIGEVYHQHINGGGQLQNIDFAALYNYIYNQIESDQLSIDKISGRLIDAVI